MSSSSSSHSSIPWTSFKVLSFDVFGTLIDWESGIYTSFTQSPIGPHLRLSLSSPPNPSKSDICTKYGELKRSVHRESPGLRESVVQAEAIRRWASELQLVESGALTQAQVEESARMMNESMGTWAPFEDTVAAMQALGKHYKLVPLSNCDVATFAQTCEGPLKGVPWAARYLSEEVGKAKPSKESFEYLLSHVKTDFGAEKEQLCHVACSLYHDCAPAKEFGIVSVWVDRKGSAMGVAADSEARKTQEEYGYALKVRTLGELAEIVDKAWGNA